VSYTTGVPPVVGAMMMFRGEWTGKGVFNVEQLPPVPFLEELGKQGLPWHVEEIDKQDQKKLFSVET
jgi:saccharopine dehydrogenase (NAD+, L-lysine-forming)